LHGSRKTYRGNLPEPEDTTLAHGRDLLTPGFLRLIGEILFGRQWQTPLADGLSHARGKSLSPATVHRWTTNSRSIPAWVSDALVETLEANQQEFERRARLAGELARRMRSMTNIQPDASAVREHGDGSPEPARDRAIRVIK
jgi:hypothetical protein